MNLKKLFLMLTFFVLLGTTAFAQVYVSATNGDDTFGTGAQVTPYRSIQKAIDVAATGSTIYVEAGIYNSGVIPTEGAPITLATNRNFTFVGTAVGLNTTVELTNGFTLNHASAVVNFGSTGTAKFNVGTTATALILTAGTMTITPANFVIGSGATVTVGNGVLNGVPTTGANLNVIFNGTNAIGSTSGFLPSALGTGTLTINKASGAITIDNTALTLTNIVYSNVAGATISGNVTLANGGDITNSNTGTLTIGTDASNTLTMTSIDPAQGQIIVNAGGSVIVNSSVTYNVRNAGTAASGASSAVFAAGNIFALTGASNLTVNGNITFNNTNIASTDGDNAERNGVTLSNNGTGSLTIAGNITTPLSSTVFATPGAGGAGTNQAWVDVILDNLSTGSFSVRSAALRGATGTAGINNAGGGSMTLGQAGDVITTAYDVVNSGATAVMTVNAGATFSSAFTTVNAASLVTFNAAATIGGIVTHAGKMRINSNVITLTRTGAGTLAGAGDIYSVTTATTGSGWIKFTGASPTSTFTGNLPNVEANNATTALALAGNNIFGDLKTTGTGATIGGASDIRGNLDLASGGGTVTINGATTVRGNVEMTSGNVTLGTNNLTVNGTFNMPQGTFTFGANTLNLVGNFNRTGGTINAAAAGTGTLNFAGTASQTFNPGTQMNVYRVTVNNTGPYLVNVIANDVVTMQNSLIVLNDFTITTGQVALGTSNIRMQQVAGALSARFTNGGRGYTSNGIGGIIFEGTGANPAGGGDGAVITGTQPFSNIYVRLSVPANNILTLGAVKISGVITFDGGGIEVGAANDGDAFAASTLALDDALVIPTVVINTQNAHASPYFVTTAPTVTSVYNLSYTGQTARTITAADFITGAVNNLSLIAGTAGKTITFLNAPGTIVGSLSVDDGETLQLTNGGAQTLTASGNTAAHVVNGTVTGGTLQITGTAASLTGGVGATNASLVANLTVAPLSAGTFTSTGMKNLGNVVINQANLVSNITMNSATAAITSFTNTAGTTNLNMNSTVSGIAGNFTVTAGAVTLTMNGGAAGTRTIAGALAVNGGSLTLGSHINVTGAASQAGAGSLALGNYNLTLANTYAHAGTGTITAGTGAIVAATALVPATYTFTTAVDIPNLTVNSPAAGIQMVTTALNVTNKLVHTAGDIDVNGLALNVTGDTYTYTAGTYSNTAGTAAGKVVLKGSALTITGAANPLFGYLEVNSTGTVTFQTSDLATPTARSFQVADGFTHTAGNIALGINDLELTNDAIVTVNAAYTTAATAGTVTGTATGANLGEVVFSGNFNGVQNLTLADNYSIQNLRVANTAHTSVTKTDTKILTVVSNFGLGDNFTFGATARLVLGDGATITRINGVFDQAPTFGATTNVVYNAALNTNKELPLTGLNNLTINGNVTFTASAPATGSPTVNGTLFMQSGTIDLATNSKVLTIADGATINRSGGAFGGAAADKPTVTNYKLVYSGAAALTDGKELISTNCTNLTVSMTGGGVTLGNARTVGSFDMSPTGAGAANVYFAIGADNALQTFTVTGTTTINNGIVSTTDAVGGNSSASTFAAQGSVVVNGGSLGNLGADNGAGVDGGLNLTFSGAAAQALTLNGNITLPNITLNSTATTAAGAVVNVTGGNLTITNLLTFQNGILNMGSNTLTLPRPTGAANGGLAFDRSAVGVGEFGHVVGKIARQANSNDGAGGTNGRFEFPTGTLSGEYRPAAINFTPAYVVNNPVIIEVNHLDVTPEGTVGLPLDGGNGVKIGNYPKFYWLVNTTPSSLSSTQNFDIDLQANNIGLPYTSDALLRIIRRQDGAATSNAWSMQGVASNYANYQVVTGTDTTVVARTTSSQGGLVQQGSRFAIGVPTRAPMFTAPVALTASINENATSTIQVTADPNDVGETVAYSLVTAPTWAAINATSGLLTLTPSYSDGSATPYQIVVKALDSGGASSLLTLTITVVNVNRVPSFTATGAAVLTAQTVKAGSTLNFTYLAVDADADALTYTLTPAITPAFAGTATLTATGVLTFSPVFADAGKVFVVSVQAADGNGGTVATAANITVSYAGEKGDVDGNGTVASADASQILQHVVGLVLITDPAKVWAADANNDGVIGAIDAAWVLYKFANGSFPTASLVASEVSAEFGKLSKVAKNEALVSGNQTGTSTFALPISISNAKQVQSLYAEFAISNGVDFQNIQANLPEGWMIQSKFENGILKVAMAGINGLASGNVAVINVGLRNVETTGEISGTLTINDNGLQSLEPLKLRAIPTEFGLGQNYPNPFNPTTSIKYQIAENANVSLTVYNMLGQQVKSLITGQQEAGYYTVNWDGTNEYGSKVASGIYIYRLQAGKYIQTLKMNLLK
ncbi:MAG: T9SS type A sorting domain-containing protein [Melioribacteraceae bacterium]|nr:T9SS type A sorting domain-containing protein [Melioribacteraceae bacterium]